MAFWTGSASFLRRASRGRHLELIFTITALIVPPGWADRAGGAGGYLQSLHAVAAALGTFPFGIVRLGQGK